MTDHVVRSMRVRRRPTWHAILLVVTGAIYLPTAGYAVGTIGVAITSPGDGSSVVPGATINVTATATSTDPANPVVSAIVLSSAAGATLSVPGYSASLTLPLDFSGPLTLTAFARNTQTYGQSTPVTVIVVPNDTLVSISVTPSDYTFVVRGGTRSLRVVAKYAGGENADVSDHRLGTVYQSSAPSVATVDIDGNVTAISNGTTQITIKNGANGATVPITVNASLTTSPPVASAGINQTVAAGDQVALDGSQSIDPNEEPLTYAWSQVSGPTVILDNSTSPTPSFIAPYSGGQVQFSLKVTNFVGLESAASTSVIVQPCGKDPMHPCAGVPTITGTITSIGTQGSAAYADLTLTNVGLGPARNLTLDSVSSTVLSGSGSVPVDPVLSPIFPATLPALVAGNSTVARLFFDVPSSVGQFSVTETGSYLDALGVSHSFSLTQNYTVLVGAVAVPSVVGFTQAAASSTITGAGLVVGTVTTQSSATVVAGLVISESPIAGTSVAAKSAVKLVVSSGAAPVAVPAVVGLTQAAASSAITGAGLVVGTVTTQSSATVAAGLVISESPIAGTSVAAKSAVNLVVSTASQRVQTIAFQPITSQLIGVPLTLVASASSGLPVQFKSSTPNVCVTSGDTASFFATGPCVITAIQTGNIAYSAAAPVVRPFSVYPPKTTTNPGVTTTILSTSRSPQTLVITVRVASVSPVNGGNVFVSAEPFGTTTTGVVANGIATASITIPASVPVGTYPITAVFLGTPQDFPSVGTTTFKVVSVH